MPDTRIRARFADRVINNLTCVITAVACPGADAAERSHLQTLLKAHVFLASLLLTTCLANADHDIAAEPKRGGKKKGPAASDWSWTNTASQLLTAAARLASANLQLLFSPADVPKDLINAWSQMVRGNTWCLAIFLMIYTYC